MASPRQKFDWRILLLVPIPLLWALTGYLGGLKVPEDLSQQWRYRARGELPSPLKVVYVDIDARAISDLKNMPWLRSNFSRVAQAVIERGGAKAVGIDVVMSEAGVSEAYDARLWLESNREFARYIMKDPPVVLAASYASAEFRDADRRFAKRELPRISAGLPPLDQVPDPERLEFSFRAGTSWSPRRVGLIDTLDGGTQWVPLFAPTLSNTLQRYDHMSLALALLHWGVTPEAVQVGRDELRVAMPEGRTVVVPLHDQQFVEVNWFSPWESKQNPRVSFAVVIGMLKAKTEEEKRIADGFFADFKDAIVLIGPVDPLLQDLGPAPFDDMLVPKVGVHGNLLKTLVSGQFIRRWPDWAIFPLCVGLAVAVTMLALVSGRRGWWAKGGAALLVAGYVGFAFWVFARANFVLPLAAPLGAAFSMAFVGLGWQVLREEKQKGRIRGMFSAYLAPTVVNTLIESGKEPELGGHEAEITAYFSDIQAFSTFSEKMTPARLVELMNEYLTACTDIVQEEGGTLDKYIGDAVVAMFGAPLPLPDHAYRACVASVRVQKKIDELRQKWRAEGEKWPPVVHNLRARLGLNTGSAIIGNMGSRTRFSYTMMGDNVNLAARMESGAKLLGVYTMVTDSTRAACEQHGGDRVVFRFLDQIVVKGRSVPVGVHEVVGLKEDLDDRTRECLALHARGIERYRAQDFTGAIALFEQSARLERYQPDKELAIESNPSLLMIERCRYMQAHPPGADWNGVFVMKEKG